MPKTLVIVESPAKARTIERILKGGYEVRASYGHVRDLPESADEIPDEIRKSMKLASLSPVNESRMLSANGMFWNLNSMSFGLSSSCPASRSCPSA